MGDKVHFSELGLVNTRQMFEKAMAGGYAIPAYNFNNLEQLQAIVTACAETSSPVIIQVSKGARNYANETMLRYMAMGAVKMARQMGANIPICLHLDHGDSLELCQSCVDSGFSSVMIDGSHLPYEENVALTRQVVEYAHAHRRQRRRGTGRSGRHRGRGICGKIDLYQARGGGGLRPQDRASTRWPSPSAPATAPTSSSSRRARRCRRCVSTSSMRSSGASPGFPIVLHGASSVVQEYVELINQYGGKMEGAVGVPEEQLRRAAKSAVCKINIDSDGRLAVTARVREYLAKHPERIRSPQVSRRGAQGAGQADQAQERDGSGKRRQGLTCQGISGEAHQVTQEAPRGSPGRFLCYCNAATFREARKIPSCPMSDALLRKNGAT